MSRKPSTTHRAAQSANRAIAALMIALSSGAPAWTAQAATSATAVVAAVPVSLAEVLEAAASNADARIARLGVDAARADVVAADHAPLPVLTAKASSMDLQHGVGGGNWLTEKRVDKSIGVDWTWERGGKRALRTAAAEAAAGAARQDWRAVRRDQQILAATAFHDLRLAQSRVEDLRELAAGAEALATLMRRRVQAGDAAPQDLSRAEIEARKAANDVASARTDRETAALALARLIGRSETRLTAVAEDDTGGLATAAASTPAAPAVERAVDTAHAATGGAAVSAITGESGDDAPIDPDGLRAAIDANPDVAAADARQSAALAAYDLARAGKRADVTWGASLDHYPGTSTRLLELRLQMPLQFGYQQQGEIGRAQSQLDQAREQARQARADAETALRQRWLAVSSSRALLRSHEWDLLPRARALLAQAELAYRKGASTLTDLIEARRTLRASLMDALAARHDHDVALAQWRLLTQP